MEMRKALGEEMEKLMRADERVCLFNADLANVVGLGKFRELFPDRAYDVGIARMMAMSSNGMWVPPLVAAVTPGSVPMIFTFCLA